MSRRDQYTQVAESTPFDNTGNDFDADNVQAAIEEIGASASPGFSFGRSSANNGTWLRRVGEIPSNRTGVTVGIQNPEVSQIFVSNENIETYTVGIYEHDGDSINLVQLGTVSVTSARGGNFNVSFPTSQGKQIAVRIETVIGSLQNIGVDVILKGTN
jgi:hypothetical protein